MMPDSRSASRSPDTYDLIVIGAGQGGGPLAGAMADAGWSVALVEREHVGGTCVNEGCTPTKTMIASARVAYLARRAGDFGVDAGDVTVDLASVRRRKRKVVDSFRTGSRSSLEATDGLDLIEGEAVFAGKRVVEVRLNEGGTRRLKADRVVINTGAHAFVPPIDGVDHPEVLTSKELLELGVLPSHLIVLGGGYVGIEFGQMFRRFGSDVSVIERGDQLLAREDDETASALQEVLGDEGVQVYLNTSITAIDRNDDGTLSVELDGEAGPSRLRGTHVLVAAGRAPNTASLDPGAAGVDTTDRGHVVVNERLETSAEGVYAIGDVTGGPAFTHVSYDDHRILRDRWLHGDDRTTEERPVPYTVFTDPQLGRIGLSAGQAREKGLDVQVARLPMSHVARAIETSETRGFMEAVVDRKTGQILGATILGPEGGEIASVLQVAMMGSVSYSRLRDAVFSHPTYTESLNNLFSTLD